MYITQAHIEMLDLESSSLDNRRELEEVRRHLDCRKIGSSSVNWEGLSPKSKYIIDTMKELTKKLDLVGKSLDVVQKDAHRTNNKMEALSTAKEEGVGSHSGHSRSSYSSKEER
ncbi:hypothetical protein CR513_28041, partial [Mucuna pruriens]